MTRAFQPELPPLRQEADGAIRIGGTRVLLETVIHAFQNGATPETIAQQYESVSLADVYAVIAHYLRHRDEVDQYLASRRAQAEAIHRMITSRQGDLTDIRERLARRRSA